MLLWLHYLEIRSVSCRKDDAADSVKHK